MIGMIFNCSKMPNEPIHQEEVEDPVETLLAVYSTESDDSPLSGVSVYTKEGVPATLRPWPEFDRNVTPVEFNDVEPGSYTVVGIKAGYDTTVTSVTIYPGGQETVYLVMHKIETVTPTDTTSTKVEIKAVDPTNPSILLNGNLVSPGIYDCMANGNTISATHPEYYNWGPHAFDGIPNGIKVIEINMDKIPPIAYHLTVNNGYGDGDYVEGTVVNIYADAPTIGYHFVGWVGDISYVADPSNLETTVTMPAKDITVTATYEQDVPPPTNPLRIEYSSGVVYLYGDGHENWQGLECYFPSQNESTGWYVNLWVVGQVVDDHIEWEVPAPYDHLVLWKGAVAGLEGQGGSGVLPRLPDHTVIQVGAGIEDIKSGYVVLDR